MAWHRGRTDLPEKPSDTYEAISVFYRNIAPPAGFVMPQPGDLVTCLRTYRTSADGFSIPAGAVGEVKGHFGPEDSGYCGVIVAFAEIATRRDSAGRTIKGYTSGMVVPFDYAADPQVFSYRRALAPAA